MSALLALTLVVAQGWGEVKEWLGDGVPAGLDEHVTLRVVPDDGPAREVTLARDAQGRTVVALGGRDFALLDDDARRERGAPPRLDALTALFAP